MSVRSLNKVQLIGNLTNDPELRFTPQGTAVCSFGLATNRSWTTDGGQRNESTEFHRIVAWAKLAELCSQLLFKGRRAYVEGRLQTRKWTAKDGSPRSTTEVVIDDMIILDSKYESGGVDDQGGGGGYRQDYQQHDDYDYSQGPDELGTGSPNTQPVPPGASDNQDDTSQTTQASKTSVDADQAELEPKNDIPF